MASGQCPDCQKKISLHPAKVGQLLTCPHCDTQLEVIGVDPLEFDWAYDWTWDEDEEEEEDEEQTESSIEGEQTMSGAFCPDCDERIIFNPHPRLGQKLVCPHCDADLEVISVEPLELDWAYEWSDEDMEDEDEDDDDW